MPTQIKSKPGLKSAYNGCSEEVRGYFTHLPTLLDDYPLDVCLAYVFARMELGQNMALYCGAVKIHKVNAGVAKSVIGTHHMTRESFVELYKTVFDLDLPAAAHADLESAEQTRDNVMHGKQTGDDRIRNAIARVLECSSTPRRSTGSLTGSTTSSPTAIYRAFPDEQRSSTNERAGSCSRELALQSGREEP